MSRIGASRLLTTQPSEEELLESLRSWRLLHTGLVLDHLVEVAGECVVGFCVGADVRESVACEEDLGCEVRGATVPVAERLRARDPVREDRRDPHDIFGSGRLFRCGSR